MSYYAWEEEYNKAASQTKTENEAEAEAEVKSDEAPQTDKKQTLTQQDAAVHHALTLSI